MKAWIMALAGVALVSLTSCVNEWPHPEDRTYAVTFLVHSDTDWLPDYEMNYTRVESLEIQYQFEIFPAGNTTTPVKEFTVYSSDLSRQDFSIDVSLNPGSYDVYVWSDICDSANGKSLFYNSSDFANITYLTPYVGDTNNKDAFRGQKSFTIDYSMDLKPTATEVINLERPFARYIFVATDLDDFVEEEETRGRMRHLESRESNFEAYSSELTDVLGDYTIKISYPLYMPAVFDNFQNKPIDSWTGISFTGNFTVLSTQQAQLGLDYVMINGEDSFVQVALEIWDAKGEVISKTSTINIPTKRDRTTIVYGRFLTTLENSGVTIDPDFAGQFNIEYK